MEGTVKRVMRDRGFGFIHTQNGQEVFFHRSSLQQLDFEAMKEGQYVEFELLQSEKGLRAANVRASWTERRSVSGNRASARSGPLV
jgi:cold shock protein